MPTPINVPVIAIVGGDTLLGRELRDQLSERRVRGRVQMIGAEEATNVISIESDEPSVIVGMDEDRLRDSAIVLLAGSPSSSRRALELLGNESRTSIVDVSYGLEDRPEARLRAPLLETEGSSVPPAAIHVIAHPAAMIVAMVLRRIHSRFPIRHSVIQLFEPASERGQAGITELQQQTTQLLTFKGLTKDVFDAQLSFNLLPRLGGEAPRSLEHVEQLIDRHIATLLGAFGGPHMPSMRLAQAPVFHGYSFSFWLEFETNPGPRVLAEAVACAQIEVRAPDLDPPSNVGAAGQSGAIAGVIEADRNHSKAIWLWAAADNFRVSADAAVDVVQALMEERAR